MKKIQFLRRILTLSALLVISFSVLRENNLTLIGKTSIFTIGDGDVAGLIAAINSANNEISNPGPDTIELAAAGTYTLTAIDNSDPTHGPSGLPVITSNITIHGNNATIQRSSAGGTPNFRIALIGATGNLSLDHATLKNGITSSSTSGGGMSFVSGSVGLLDNVTFDGNSTGTSGGALRNAGTGVLTITNSTFQNNHANSSGGAVVNDPTAGGVTNMVVSNTVFTSNSAGSAAGAIENTGKISLNAVQITSNTAGEAGGIRNRSGIMTLTNSLVNLNSATGVSKYAGGLFSTSSTETIDNTTFTGNTSTFSGGGIAKITLGTLTMTNSTIQSNSSTSNGGGYYSSGTVNETMTNVVFDGNSSNVGGGLRKDGTGTLTLTNSTVKNNTAGFAGGGMAMNANAVVTGTLFDSNTASLTNASAYGGGFATGNTGGTVTLSNSTISNNHAPNAGGVDLYSVISLSNATISGNTATESAGGMKIESSAQVTHSSTTITNNTADHDGNGSGTAGGILQLGTNTTMSNTIVAGNVDGSPGGVSDHVDCGGVVSSVTTSGGYNLIGQINTGVPTHCNFVSTVGDQVGTVAVPILPLLGALANNGGITFTHLLLAGSPAIDAGNPAGPGSGGNSCTAADQRGVFRPSDGNSDFVQRCDIGSVELDPPEVILQETSSTTDTSESGSTDTYKVFLNKLPVSDVVINMAPDAQVNVSVPSLTFTTANWNTPQTVTVSAVDDLIAEGNHTGIISHSSVSSDPNYSGLVVSNLSVNIADNDAAGVLIQESGGSTDISETGTLDTYNVVLSSLPTADVTVNVSFDAQSNASPASLTFTALDWNVPQTVTVNAVDDLAAEGIHHSTISHTASSTDLVYNGISIQNVTATITDNDTAGVIVAETGGSTDAAEGGATDTYSVVLTSLPAANVGISLLTGTQITPSQSLLTFTPANWNTPQIVTVSANNDTVAEGLHTSTIVHNSTSTDANYNAVPVASVIVNITDDEVAGVIFTGTSGITVAEGGANATFTVVLNAQPTDDVLVNFTSDTQVTSTPSVLTFTPANWNIPQTVTVQAVQDTVVESSHNGTIAVNVSGSSTVYSSLVIADIIVAINDDDQTTATPPPASTGSSATGGTGGSAPDIKPSPLVETTQEVTPAQQPPQLSRLPRPRIERPDVIESVKSLCPFTPDQIITRAEMVCIVLERFHLGSSPFEFVFVDLGKNNKYSEQIVRAKKKDIVEGYESSEFRIFKPQKPVTRGEALKIFLRGQEITLSSDDIDLVDVKPADWFYTYVAYAVRNDVIAPYHRFTTKTGRVSKYYRFPRLLGYGDQGPDVQRLKKLMAELQYYRWPIDNVYDDGLVEAITNFQKNHHLAPVGQMGEHTKNALMREIFSPHEETFFAPYDPVTGADVEQILSKIREK
ncbi:MAG: choice-of-anchor Q domain-containing protein [Candidatus Gracilibacteria bacterium]